MKKYRYVACLLIFIFLFSCAGLIPVPIQEMTPKQRAAYFMGIYNRQDKDYKTKAAMPNLTEDQKKILREKRTALIKVYPLIQAYDIYVTEGNIPNKDIEREIMDLLSVLEQMVIN
jgi:disulfide oxidoreductase YuzD